MSRCRHEMFGPDWCLENATWKGDPTSPDAFVVAWRACEWHKTRYDVRIEIVDARMETLDELNMKKGTLS